MKQMFKNITKPVKLTDAVLIDKYEEIEDVELSTITKRDGDKERLSGMIIRGYETKFANNTNTNGERYEKTALDAFVQKYYVDNKLNMPVTIQHDNNRLIGRVLLCEVNSVGFYFICYLPKSLPTYEETRSLIKEGILQGLSKEGWATKGKWVYTKDGEWDYFLVEEMEMTAVSLVCTPANGVPLEKAEEIRNATAFENKTKKPKSKFSAMFKQAD